MHFTQTFLIFNSFVSPLEKLRKRPQENENQKGAERTKFRMNKTSLKKEGFWLCLIL
jgi:hypothetical protein